MIHKGEPTSPPFEHAKTRSFKSYTWLEQELKDHYAKILGLDRFERDGLHIPQQKTFKYQNREKAERIRENNQIIREFNEIVDYALSKHVLESDLKEIIEPLKDSVKRNKKNRTNALKNALNELRRGVRQLTMTLEDIWNTIKSHHHTYTIAKYNARMCGYELDEFTKLRSTYPDIFFGTLMYSKIKYHSCLSSLISFLIMCFCGSIEALFCWTFIRYFSEQNTLLKVIRISTSDSMNF